MRGADQPRHRQVCTEHAVVLAAADEVFDPLRSNGIGRYVLTLAGDRICAMTRFDTSVLPSFGLPRSLPS